MPRVLGPGPSPQNQPDPQPSMFSLAQPIEIEVGPNPTQPAELAKGELEQPTPGMFIVRPSFIASAWTTAPMA